MSAQFGYHANGAVVRVAVAGDPYRGRVGTVIRSYNDAGEMVHVVEFGDGENADYTTEELRSGDVGNRWHRQER